MHTQQGGFAAAAALAAAALLAGCASTYTEDPAITELRKAGRYQDAAKLEADINLEKYSDLGCAATSSRECSNLTTRLAWNLWHAERYAESYAFFSKWPGDCGGRKARGMLASLIKQQKLDQALGFAERVYQVFPMQPCDTSTLARFGYLPATGISPDTAVATQYAWLLERLGRAETLTRVRADQQAVFEPLRAAVERIKDKAGSTCDGRNAYYACQAAAAEATTDQYLRAQQLLGARASSEFREFFNGALEYSRKDAKDWRALAARDQGSEAFGKAFSDAANAAVSAYNATRPRGVAAANAAAFGAAVTGTAPTPGATPAPPAAPPGSTPTTPDAGSGAGASTAGAGASVRDPGPGPLPCRAMEGYNRSHCVSVVRGQGTGGPNSTFIANTCSEWIRVAYCFTGEVDKYEVHDRCRAVNAAKEAGTQEPYYPGVVYNAYQVGTTGVDVPPGERHEVSRRSPTVSYYACRYPCIPFITRLEPTRGISWMCESSKDAPPPRR
jgi:hypothetical protein